MSVMIQEKQGVSVANESYDLVKGEFSPKEAAEIFNDLFYKKINFNEQRRFSQEIRFGEYDKRIDTRLIELREAKNEILKWVEKAEESGKTLKVNAAIHIELI